jgi:hypothetical protein
MDDTAGLDAALMALFWVSVALVVLTIFVSWMLSRFGAGRRGAMGFVLAFGVVVSVEIGSIVVWRAFNHEMTAYDFVWLLAFGVIGASCASRLFRERADEREHEYQAQ